MPTDKQKKTSFGDKVHTLTQADRSKAGSRDSSPRDIKKIREVFYKIQKGVTPQVGKWLLKIAEGVPRKDDEGNVIHREDGSIVYDVNPDPKGAIDTFLKLSRFVIPELSAVKVETTIRDGKTEVKLPPWMIENDDSEDNKTIVIE